MSSTLVCLIPILNFWFNSWIQIHIKRIHFILSFKEFISYLILCNSKFKPSQNFNHHHLIPKTISYKLNHIQHPSYITSGIVPQFCYNWTLLCTTSGPYTNSLQKIKKKILWTKSLSIFWNLKPAKSNTTHKERNGLMLEM